MTDRWIEAAEARKVCEWAMAEQPSARAATSSSVPTLCERLVLEAAHLRHVLAVSTRLAA